MKYLKHLLFLGILCSLLVFTNCGDDSDDAITSKPTLTITISPSGGGSVSPQGGTYDAGTTVELTATANVDYTFTGWTGDFTGSSNPVTLTMLTNQTIIANYEFHDADGDGVGDSVDNCAETPSDATADENGCSNSNEIYLDENGVTMKATEDAIIGEVYSFNGANYRIVDRDLLLEMISNFEDVTYVITSNITDMSRISGGLNLDTKLIIGDISGWDVSNVTMMEAMLAETSSRTEFDNYERINQDLSKWDVGNVTWMRSMFYGSMGVGDLSNWDVSKVTNMNDMFHFHCINCDEDYVPDLNIGSWDVSNVESMGEMFAGNKYFNEDISSWDISSVNTFYRMFQNATAFNQDIGSWDVSNVGNMVQMFNGAITFNGDISEWDVSNMNSLDYMFSSATSFNQDISSWDVSNVGTMTGMFYFATAFNQDLSSWNVENVVQCNQVYENTDAWVAPKPNFKNCRP